MQAVQYSCHVPCTPLSLEHMPPANTKRFLTPMEQSQQVVNSRPSSMRNRKDLQFRRRRVPLRVPLSGEQPHGQGGGADYANALVLQVRHKLQQRCVVEAVMAVGQNNLHRSLGRSIQHISSQRERGYVRCFKGGFKN
jgi:hypothetical protein